MVGVVGGSTADARTHRTWAGQERRQWLTPAHCAHAYKRTTLAHTHAEPRTHTRSHTHAGLASKSGTIAILPVSLTKKRCSRAVAVQPLYCTLKSRPVLPTQQGKRLRTGF